MTVDIDTTSALASACRMRFKVLGPMAVEDPAGHPLPLQGLRQRAVLAVLLIEAGRMVTAERMADMVWDGEPPPQAAGTLQAYISRLRRRLEPDADGRTRPWRLLKTVGAGYQLDLAPGSLDSAEFEDLCASEHGRPTSEAIRLLDGGLALWRGEAYADFRYFNFVRSEVHRLEERRWWAEERRAELYLSAGRHLDVVQELSALVPTVPYRERMRGLLMLALYRSGRQADALACYREGRERLVEDLGIDPGPDLQRLEHAIIEQDPALDGAVAAAAPQAVPPAIVRSPVIEASAGRPPMVGREGELKQLRSFLERLSGGDGALVLVQGEAGIGKTRLTEEAAHLAAASGVEVVWGRCPAMEGAPPFWPWMQILRSLVPDDQIPDPLRLGPPLDAPADAGGDAGAGYLLYEAVAAILRARADRRPLLMILEDIHWADNASLRLLRYLSSAGGGSGAMGAIATSREEHDSPTLREIEADAARTRTIPVIRLHRLERPAATELVMALAGEDVAPRVVESVVDRSGGNPFFIGELIRLGAAGAQGVPQGVKDVIDLRVDRLSAETRSMLAVAACHPGAVDISIVAAVLEQSLPMVLDQADEALGARLLREVAERPGLFEFSHPLVRDAIANSTSGARRAHIHRSIAEVLSRRMPDNPDDESVSALAHHYAEAGDVIRAVAWSTKAARREIRRGAGEDALARVERAMTALSGIPAVDQSGLVELLILRAQAERLSGLGSGAESVHEAMCLARQMDDPLGVVEAARVLTEDAWGYTVTFGKPEHGLVEQLQWALPKLEAAAPGRWVETMAAIATELVFAEPSEVATTGSVDSVGEMSAAALRRARQVDDPRALHAALLARWVTIWGPGTLAERSAVAAELEATATEAGLERSPTLLLRWANALEGVEPVEAQSVIDEAEELASQGRSAALRALVAWRRSLRAILDARFEEAETLIGEAYSYTARFHPQEAFDAFSGQTALLYYLSGRFASLEPVLAQAISEQPYLRPAFGPPLALALLDAGRTEEAVAELDKLGLERLERVPPAMVRSGTTSTLAVCVARLADPVLASVVLPLLGDDSSSPAIVDHMGVFYNGARAAHRGRLLLVLDRVDEAVAALERGLEVDTRAWARVFALRDRCDLAEALTRRAAPGDLIRAAELASCAAAEAEELGLTADAKRALGLLERAGD